MTTLLVFAGSHQEYRVWCHEFESVLELGGFTPRYIDAKSLNYMGYDGATTKWVAVGRWAQAGYHPEVFWYLETKQIQKLPQ